MKPPGDHRLNRPWFHLPGLHFGYPFLTHSHMADSKPSGPNGTCESLPVPADRPTAWFIGIETACGQGAIEDTHHDHLVGALLYHGFCYVAHEILAQQPISSAMPGPLRPFRTAWRLIETWNNQSSSLRMAEGACNGHGISSTIM